jgi:hypothetical protein
VLARFIPVLEIEIENASVAHTPSCYDTSRMQVIAGSDDTDDGLPWYFSLNNRRLWVLKRCKEEGLLNQIRVRVRAPKSKAEAERYCVANCALEAKVMRETTTTKERSVPPSIVTKGSAEVVRPACEDSERATGRNVDDSANNTDASESDDDDDPVVSSHRFTDSALY